MSTDYYEEHSFTALIDDLWHMPQMRLVAFSTVLTLWFIIVWQFGEYKHPNAYKCVNWLTLALLLITFWRWTAAQYARVGFLQMTVKWLTVGCSIALVYTIICGHWPWQKGPSLLLFRGDAISDPWLVIGELWLFTALATSRLSEVIVAKYGARLWDSKVMREIRRWF